MKRYVATAAFAGIAAALALLGANGQRAEAAEPSNFLERVVCSQEARAVNATFLLPSAGDVGDILDDRGVNGTLDEIWIDLTLFDNNFARGTFLGFGPFGVVDDAGTFGLEGLIPVSLHHYRLNALVDGRWHELGRAEFETPTCNAMRGFECEGSGTVSVLFELPAFDFTPGRPVEVWLDLSLFNNGFARGTFIGSGPFPPPESASAPSPPPIATRFRWEGIVSARLHFVRLNVLTDEGEWHEVVTSFLTPDCRDLAGF